jgi:hypothetical protein
MLVLPKWQVSPHLRGVGASTSNSSGSAVARSGIRISSEIKTTIKYIKMEGKNTTQKSIKYQIKYQIKY